MRRLSSPLPALTAALLLTSLAACGPVNRTSETVHIPNVTRSALTYDIPVGSGSISGAQAKALDDYLGAIHLRYGDRIQLDDPSSYGAAERRESVAAVVDHFGLLLDPATGQGTATAGTLRVTIIRTTAEVPNCPDWRRASQPEYASSTASNFGCATQSNLAAMVADPSDLLEGKGSDITDTTSAARAIRAYRNAKVTSEAAVRNSVTNGGAVR